MKNYFAPILDDLVDAARHQTVLFTVAATAVIWLAWMLTSLVSVAVNSSGETDTILVLGGSVAREVYAATLCKRYPRRTAVISGGEPPPCTLEIFRTAGAPIENVILERSSTSTFENFTYSLPILKKLKAKKVGVITSIGNEQRAFWMARIFLWSNGIAVDNEVIPGQYSQGGHNETPLKTMLDVSRSLLCSPLTAVFNISGKQIPLKDVETSDKCICQPVPAELVKQYQDALGPH